MNIYDIYDRLSLTLSRGVRVWKRGLFVPFFWGVGIELRGGGFWNVGRVGRVGRGGVRHPDCLYFFFFFLQNHFGNLSSLFTPKCFMTYDMID